MSLQSSTSTFAAGKNRFQSAPKVCWSVKEKKKKPLAFPSWCQVVHYCGTMQPIPPSPLFRSLPPSSPSVLMSFPVSFPFPPSSQVREEPCEGRTLVVAGGTLKRRRRRRRRRRENTFFSRFPSSFFVRSASNHAAGVGATFTKVF